MATLQELIAEREKALGAQPVPQTAPVQLGNAQAGNINLDQRPVVNNPDGSISTVKSISINEDGKEILIPTISPSGQQLTDEGAIALYHRTGNHLGVFNSPEEATAAAQAISARQGVAYGASGGLADLEAQIAAREAQLQKGTGSGAAQAVASTFGDAALGGLENFLGGVNERIATVLALPGAAVDEALKAAGMEIFAGRDPAQTGLNQFKEGFRAAGINVDPEEGLAAQMGRSSIDTALTTAALFAAAPAWAARSGVGVRKTIGDFITQNPLLFAAGEQASIPGSVLGAKGGGAVGGMADRALGSDDKIGENIGGMVGGTLGGALTGMAAPLVARGLRGKTPPPIGTEPVNPQGSPQEVTRFAQEQVAGDLLKVDNDIARAVNLVRSDKTPEAASAAVRNELEAAKLRARGVETSLWNRVDKKVEIDPNPIRQAIVDMRNDTVRNGAKTAFPADWATDLLRATNPKTRAPGAPATPVSAEHLLNARSELRTLIRAQEGLPGGGNRKLVANMEELDKVIMDQLGAQLPDNQALAAARQFSYDINERFTRGPVGDVLRQRMGGDLVDPGQTMQALLAKHGRQAPGVEAAQAVAKGIPGQPATAAPDLTPAMEDAVRAEFQQIITSDDPEIVRTAANNFLKKNAKQVKELGTVAGDMKVAVDGLKAGLEQRKIVTNSALAKYAKAAPEKVVSQIFGSVNPKEAVGELLSRGMAGDQDAIDGLRSLTIQHILRRSMNSKGQISPEKFRNNLNPNYYNAANDAYKEIFSPDQYRALREIANDAAEADVTAFGKGVKAATIISRFIGAGIARAAGNATGLGGTIQGPAIGANLAAGFTENQFKRMPAGELIELAIMSPAARGVLRNRAPSTAAEMRAIAAKLRRITSAGNALNTLEGGNQDRAK